MKGLLAVMRGLPEHSVCERKQILESLDFLVRRCFMRGGNGKVGIPPHPPPKASVLTTFRLGA